MIKDGQPCSHAVLDLFHVFRLDFMAFQLLDHIVSHGVVIHRTDKCRFQLDICDVLRHVSRNAAVDLDHSSGISSLRNIRGQGIPLNIYKHISDYYNSHRNSPLSMSFISDLYPVGAFGI